MKYLLIDMANNFYRARHSVHRASTLEDKLGFSLHVALASIGKAWREQKADHVVICLDGRSWRKDFYPPYKANRAVARSALSDSEKEEETRFYETFDALAAFLTDKTNCTVLQHNNLEADDLIAGWVRKHPNDQHTIVSSDSDFYQLLAGNVNQYNGISDELHTLTGIFDKKGNLVIDKKTKLPKKIPDPTFILFEKCVRGDPTDNVFSAYPGVRTKGTKNKVGLEEAFADKDRQGYAWNNLMLQKFTHHDGTDHRVLDDYNRNVILIDLTKQPEDIIATINDTIDTNSVAKARPLIGTYFLKFCGKFDLVRLSENASSIAEWMTAGYSENS